MNFGHGPKMKIRGQKYSFSQKMIFEHRPKTIIRGQKKTFFQKMNSEIWTRMDNLQYRFTV